MSSTTVSLALMKLPVQILMDVSDHSWNESAYSHQVTTTALLLSNILKHSRFPGNPNHTFIRDSLQIPLGYRNILMTQQT